VAATVRPVAVRLIFAALLYVTLEVVSLAGLWLIQRRRGTAYFPAASELRPSTKEALDAYLSGGREPSVVLDSTLGWRRVTEVTAQGVRDDVTYAPEAPPGTVRIAAFGDSFTYGSDVALGQNWSKRMAALDSTVEVLNYGVGAFGLDQAYLRYMGEGTALRPHIVFIGYLTENIARNVNVFRGFYGPGYPGFFFTKPRFRLNGDSLVLLANPLRTMEDYRRLQSDPKRVLAAIGENDFHVRGLYASGPLDFSPTVRLMKLVLARARQASDIPILTPDGRYDTRSEAYDLTRKIFDSFHAGVVRDGAVPIIVVFPDINDHRRSRAGDGKRHAELLRYFDSRGYRYIDLIDAFKPVEARYPVDSLVVKWGHLSPIGNDLAARHILDRLREWNLVPAK
jgi:hypothetical protein